MIHRINILLILAFSTSLLKSQIIFSNDSVNIEIRELFQYHSFILTIENKTDEVIVLNAAAPRVNDVDSTICVDAGITKLPGVPSFLEPLEQSVLYFRRVLPYERYTILVKLDPSIPLFEKVKYCYFELHYFIRPFGSHYKCGIENNEIRKLLCITGTKLNRLKINFNLSNLQNKVANASYSLSQIEFDSCKYLSIRNKKKCAKRFILDEYIDDIMTGEQYKSMRGYW